MLKHPPTTELEYWQALEACDKTVLRLGDGLRRRLIPQDEVAAAQEAIRQANQVSATLIQEIERKFQVFCHKNHSEGMVKPKGMESFIDWWNKMDSLAQAAVKTGAKVKT